MKEFLPVGSVVLLKDAKQPLIIIGHSALEGNQLWDYLGAIYPFGMMGEEKNLLFQRGQIEKVIFRGYEDEEGRKYLKLLEETFDKLKHE